MSPSRPSSPVCIEASAPKPGNVSPGRHFADARYEDFLASAAAIGEPMAGAGRRPVGMTVRLAVEATVRWTRSNTNLGSVLLLAPLARAAFSESMEGSTVRLEAGATSPPVVSGFSLNLSDAVRRVLEATTVEDARDVYTAIRLAAPGGLGRVAQQDVADEPTLTLVEAMRLAADRDLIAREYTTAFELTFQSGVPALERARGDGLSWDDAVVETFLTLLAAAPDTHIARRGGAALAAGGVAAGADRPCRRRRPLGGGAARDRRHGSRTARCAPHRPIPGTAADLTAAAIFVVLLGGGWHGGRDAASR